MKRFFGVMPAEEIHIKGMYRDSNNLLVTIEAGPNGWTIIWADHSVDYVDVVDTAKNNFKKAYDYVVVCLGPLEQCRYSKKEGANNA